jgi:hypothetical protein
MNTLEKTKEENGELRDIFDQLSDEDKKIYLRELIELAMIYNWDCEMMPKGKFFGRKK